MVMCPKLHQLLRLCGFLLLAIGQSATQTVLLEEALGQQLMVVFFRGSRAAFLGCFASYIGIATSILAELLAAIHAIELADKNG